MEIHKKNLNICFLGDFYSQTKINDNFIDKNITQFLKEKDLVICNFEGSLFSEKNNNRKRCKLLQEKNNLTILKKNNIKALCLSNNHIFDFGDASFIKTKKNLEENGFFTFGGGKNIDEARDIKIIKIKGTKIGFLSYSWNITGAQIARKNKPGVAPLNKKQIIEDIKKNKSKTDILIISLHWGFEKERYPLPKDTILAKEIINAGADIIYGHHPHVLQGVEKYKEKHIIYSAGNFIFSDINTKRYNIKQNDEQKKILFTSIEFNNSKQKLTTREGKITNKIKFVKEKIINELSEIVKHRDYKKNYKSTRDRKDLPIVNGKRTDGLRIYLKKKINIIKIIFFEPKKIIRKINTVLSKIKKK